MDAKAGTGQEFLSLKHVNVARGERVVLHDVNLEIRAGEHVAILGPNGCGKSSLILAMTLLGSLFDFSPLSEPKAITSASNRRH